MTVAENFQSLLLCCVAALGLSWTCSPLLLTPLLDEGRIEQARQLSDVKDPAGIIPKSYSGFITVDKTLGNHLFFWFFPATHDPTAPVVVWLNGGPGVPSTFGLLYENGPIQLKTSTDGDVSYERREHSWIDAFSLLYIDNPVETGYSYTESGEAGLKTTQEGYSTDLYNFMEQFYIMFPEYLDKQLYIGGQSYAGHYVTALAYRIHQKITAKKSQLPLTGIYLGGPFFDPQAQTSAYLDYMYALGGISYAQVVRAKEAQAEFFGSPHNNNTAQSFSSVFLAILLPQSGLGPVDYYAQATLAPYHEVTQFMTSDVIRTALHIGNGCKFKTEDVDLRDHFILDVALSVNKKLAVLMDNYKVLIFNGDFDAIITPNGIEEGLLSIPWSLQAQYNASEKSTWYSKTSKSYSEAKGFYQHVGQFCRVVIRGAGHQTPHDQPDVTLEMMRHFVEEGCIKEVEEEF